MASPPFMSTQSPPPLFHPKPTHPAYPPPEPPHTPGRSTASSPYSQPGRLSQDGAGYARFSSPPVGFDAGQGQGHGHGQQQAQVPMGQHQHAASTSYAPPTGNLHARGYGPQGPNAPVGYGGPGGNFAGGNWPGMNDATAQMGVQFGRSAISAGQSYVEQNITRYLPLAMVKTCFQVTNSYVLRKLRIVLFPWRHRPWSRQVLRVTDNGGVDGWQPPREDINAPDLYIPTMALVTYMFLFAFARGVSDKFRPDVLGESLSKALAVVVLEFVVIKLGCYFLDVRDSGGASSVELLAYGGYKFVGIITTIIVGLFHFGMIVDWTVFLYTFCANAFFLLRSLKYVLLPDPNNASGASAVATLSNRQRSQRVQFLFVVAMTQIVWMGWLSQTK